MPIQYQCVLAELKAKHGLEGPPAEKGAPRYDKLIDGIIEHGPWREGAVQQWAAKTRVEKRKNTNVKSTGGDHWVPGGPDLPPGPLAEVDSQRQTEIRKVKKKGKPKPHPIPGMEEAKKLARAASRARLLQSLTLCSLAGDTAEEVIINVATSTRKNPKILDDSHWETPETFGNWLGGVDLEFVRQSQAEDSEINFVREQVEKSATRPLREALSTQPKAVKAYIQQWDDLAVCKGILLRRKHLSWTENKCGTATHRWQLVAPQGIKKEIFEYLHCGKTGGHMGVNKTWKKIKDKFYWWGHKSDILAWCRECGPCQRHKFDKRRQKAPLVQYPEGSAMSRIAIDFVGPLPITDKGNTVMLVVVDYFTKWGEAFALPDQTAQTTADCLVENFFSRFGLPERIHSDQGSNFESTLFKEMTELMGIKKT
jgi:hypothetical protein